MTVVLQCDACGTTEEVPTHPIRMSGQLPAPWAIFLVPMCFWLKEPEVRLSDPGSIGLTTGRALLCGACQERLTEALTLLVDALNQQLVSASWPSEQYRQRITRAQARAKAGPSCAWVRGEPTEQVSGVGSQAQGGAGHGRL